MYLTVSHGTTNVGRVRETNEDCFLIDDPIELYGVFDGMGGHLGGEVASRTASRWIGHSVRAYLSDEDPADDRATLLGRAFEEAHQRIRAMGKEKAALSGMGTTATVMWRNQNQMIFCHVGDSRAYVFRHGLLNLLTSDHTLASEMISEGHVFENEAAFRNFDRILTQAMGGQRPIQPSIFACEIEPDDQFILCTDGVSRYIDETIVTELEKLHKENRLSEWLVANAVDKGGIDNATAVVVAISRELAGETNVAIDVGE